MMLRDVKVVGYRKFKAKNGNVCVQLSVTYKREPNDTDVDIAGEVAETFFVPGHVEPKISSKDVGQTIKIVDAFYGNKNNLVDVLR